MQSYVLGAIFVFFAVKNTFATTSDEHPQACHVSTFYAKKRTPRRGRPFFLR
jgi:hypothetical protein